MPEHPSCLPFSLGLENEPRLGGRRMGLTPAQFSLLVTIAKPRFSLPEMKDLDSCSADLSRICDASQEREKAAIPCPLLLYVHHSPRSCSQCPAAPISALRFLSDCPLSQFLSLSCFHSLSLHLSFCFISLILPTLPSHWGWAM